MLRPQREVGEGQEGLGQKLFGRLVTLTSLSVPCPLSLSLLSDSKRQQTTTVDYKRLING